MGEMSKIIQSFVYFHFFEALTCAFEVQFLQASFLHLIKDTELPTLCNQKKES